jgi:hypothetical protein
MEPDEEAIDIHGLAKMLSIHMSTAYVRAGEPDFPTMRVGNRYRFFPSEVRAYFARPVDPWQQSARSLGRKRLGR